MKEITLEKMVEDDDLFIRLSDEKCKEFFQTFSSSDFYKVFPYNTYRYRWFRDKTDSIKIGSIKKLLSLKNMKISDILEDIEFIGVKTRFHNTFYKIHRTKFPIKLTPELAEIIGNLLGDGCIGLGKMAENRPSYTNQDKVLIDNFIKNMEKIFGSLKYDLREPNLGKNAWMVNFPSIIGIIFKKMFSDNKWNTYEGTIPQEIMEAPKEIKTSFLKAIFNDEGTHSKTANQIQIGLSNRALIEQVCSILKSLNIECSISENRDYANKGYARHFTISISGRHNIRCFWQKIGLIENSKKYFQFKDWIENLPLRAEDIYIGIIQELQENGSVTVYDLAKKLGKHSHTINRYLAKMRQVNVVSVERSNKKNIFAKYRLTNTSHDLSFTNPYIYSNGHTTRHNLLKKKIYKIKTLGVRN